MVTTAEIGLDIFDPKVIARPHEFYAQLRKDAPIVWSEQMQSWLLTRYEDVRTVIRNSDEWSSVRGPVRMMNRPGGVMSEMMSPPGTLTMLGADPPDHTRLRKLVDRDFTPGRLGVLVPHLQEITDSLLEGAATKGTFDVPLDLAEPLPIMVIAELLGIPPELHRQFKRWSDASIEPIRPDATDEEIRARNLLIVEFREYMSAQIAARETNPTDDFIGRLVQAHDAEEKLTDAELLAAVNLLLLAGNETTTNLISNATLALWKFPEQRKLLREDPSLIDGAIEEFLRYDGSVQFTTRRAVVPAEFYGQKVEVEQSVAIVLASANRDGAVFDHPDELDIRRPKGRNFAFGDWIHICVGQHLARFETRAAILTMLKEFGDYGLAVDEGAIDYRRNFNLRGPKHLPITAGA